MCCVNNVYSFVRYGVNEVPVNSSNLITLHPILNPPQLEIKLHLIAYLA